MSFELKHKYLKAYENSFVYKLCVIKELCSGEATANRACKEYVICFSEVLLYFALLKLQKTKKV